MLSSIIIFVCFICFKSLSVLSLRLFRTFILFIVTEWSDVSDVFTNLQYAEIDLFLLFMVADLPGEACRSGQFHLSCSAEVIPETTFMLSRCHRAQFVLRNRSSVEI